VRVTVIATGFEREAATNGDAAKRRVAATVPANGNGANGQNGKHGKDADADPATEGRRGVGGFVRRMWGRRAAAES